MEELVPYDYISQRPELFTESGQVQFLAIRDKTQSLLRTAGACRCQEMTAGVSGSSWTHLARIDRLVELGEIREVTGPDKAWGQHRVFVSAKE